MKIPYGNADFADIRREGFFYVDKTPFLPELESEEMGYSNLILLRPRRDLARHGELPYSMLDVNARTDYRRLHGLWAASSTGGEDRRAALETILREGAIWSELVERFGQSRGASTTSELVSLMYYTGMLTLSTAPPEGNQHRLEPPNRVLRELGWKEDGS